MSKITYTNKVNYTDGSSDNQYFQVEDANEIKSVVNGNDDAFTTFKNLFKLYDLTIYGKTTQEGNATPLAPISIDNITGDQFVNLPNSQTITIGLGNTNNYIASIGEYKDKVVVNCQTGEIIKYSSLGKIVLDENSSITTNASVNRFNVSVSNIKHGSTSSPNAISTHYTSNYSTTNNSIFVSNSTDIISIMDNRFSTLEDYKTWLTNNNVVVYYVHKEPVKTSIGFISLEDIDKLKNITLSNVDGVTYSLSDITKNLTIVK